MNTARNLLAIAEAAVCNGDTNMALDALRAASQAYMLADDIDNHRATIAVYRTVAIELGAGVFQVQS